MSEFSIVVLSLVGCVFAASAAAKLNGRLAYRSFRDGLGETGLIPASLLPTAAGLLSLAEAIVAGALLAASGLTAAAVPGAAWPAESALVAAAALTVVLAAGVAVVVRRGTRAHCACFGARSARPIGRLHLARNLCLLTVIGAGLAGIPLSSSDAGAAGAVLAVAAGAVAALLLIRWDDLAELFMPVAAPTAQATAVPRLADDRGD